LTKAEIILNNLISHVTVVLIKNKIIWTGTHWSKVWHVANRPNALENLAAAIRPSMPYQ